MSITQEKAVRMVEIFRDKVDDLAGALIAELRQESETVEDVDAKIAADDRDLVDRPSGYDQPWSFNGIPVIRTTWMKTGEQQGETYGWPDGSSDTYTPFVTYVSKPAPGWPTIMTLGLGYKDNGEVIGFVLGAGGGSKRGITVFWNADDIATSNEKLSMIRGGGKTGRAGFGEDDPLPDAYVGFEVEMLRDRVAGKWNVKAVVADAHDHETMLNHTALQAKLRGLV